MSFAYPSGDRSEGSSVDKQIPSFVQKDVYICILYIYIYISLSLYACVYYIYAFSYIYIYIDSRVSRFFV